MGKLLTREKDCIFKLLLWGPWFDCQWGDCGIKNTRGKHRGENTSYGVALEQVEPLLNKGF
jgi:hypothetical protein